MDDFGQPAYPQALPDSPVAMLDNGFTDPGPVDDYAYDPPMSNEPYASTVDSAEPKEEYSQYNKVVVFCVFVAIAIVVGSIALAVAIYSERKKEEKEI